MKILLPNVLSKQWKPSKTKVLYFVTYSVSSEYKTTHFPWHFSTFKIKQNTNVLSQYKSKTSRLNKIATQS